MAELQIHTRKVAANARVLRDLCAARGLSLLPVVKGCGSCMAVIARLQAEGFGPMGLSSVKEGVQLAEQLTQRPQLISLAPCSKASQVVATFGCSLHSELSSIDLMAQAAGSLRTRHGIMLATEIGDLREGLLPDALMAAIGHVLDLAGRNPYVELAGMAINFACLSGLLPSLEGFERLDDLVTRIKRRHGLDDLQVSIGGSIAVPWIAAGLIPGCVSTLRAGCAILLGRVPSSPWAGLHADALHLVGEVLEAKEKPSKPWGECGEDAFGKVHDFEDKGLRRRIILDFGLLDSDPAGLVCELAGVVLVGATSHYTVLDVTDCPVDVRPGDRLGFTVHSYEAMARALDSPTITKIPCSDARELAHGPDDTWEREQCAN